MEGTVKWFNAQKGFGFISGDDGKEYFVHQSNIQMKGFRKLDEGDIVDFEVGIGGNGKKQALNVNPVLTLQIIKQALRKDKTYSRYGDLLDKVMRKKEDKMLASALRIRENINNANERKEREKFRRELEKESERIEDQNRRQETRDFANAMLDRYKQRQEAERKRKEAEEEERRRREASRRFVEHMNWMDAAISHTKEMLSK